jgi:peptide/nickel transport system substrate-binding protein
MSKVSTVFLLLVLVVPGFLPIAQADAQGEQRDIIRIASDSVISTLDPTRSVWTGSIEAFGQLYSRLLRRDLNHQLQPGLAKAWEISSDRLVYTFHLRVAHFSNGKRVTADDVVFSLLRMRDHPEAALSELVSGVADIEALDEVTVRITLAQPNTPFLATLESCFLGIVSREDVETRGEKLAFQERPVSSGPYRVTEWKRNQRLSLEPNPHYWRKGFPKNDGAVMIEGGDAHTRLSMLLAGEVDAARALAWSQVDRLRAESAVSVPHEPANMIWVILLNHSLPPFDDVRVRQAAALALDREALGKVVMKGLGELANTTLPKSLLYHDETNPGWGFDPEKAKALIGDAGAAGQQVTININAPDPRAELIALVLQAQWSAIGLQTNIVKMDQGQQEAALEAGSYNADINWWYDDIGDPDQALRWAVCGSCGNRSYYTNYHNPQVDALLAQGAGESHPDVRRDIYHRIQAISTEEVAQIPLFYPPWLNAYRREIEGLRLTPALQWTLEYAHHIDE